MSPYDRYSVVRFLEPVCLDLSSYERPGSDSRRTPGLIGKISDHWLSALPTGGDDGIRSRRELRALVARGHNDPPDRCSVPLVLRIPTFD